MYNTTDNLYIKGDVISAFEHAYNLGRSNWRGDIKKAYKEWVDEYTENTLDDLMFTDIVNAVASSLWVPAEEITNQSFGKKEGVARARLLTCWFSYVYLDYSLQDIAELMGYSVHGSILYGTGKINDELKLYAATKTIVRIIKEVILNGGHSLKPSIRLQRNVKEIIIV